MERTLFILKPDAVRRNLIGPIITRIENKGFKIVNCRMELLSLGMASQHYDEHKDKDFFSSLVAFMTSGPVLLLCVEAPDAIKQGRIFISSIRADFSIDKTENVIHASDSNLSAKREISMFFPSNILTSEAYVMAHATHQ